MNRIVLIILLSISFSCNTEYFSKNVKENNVLEYYFISGNVTEMISKAIEQFPKEDIFIILGYEEKFYDIFIILGYEEKFYKVSIVPTKNLKQTILFSMRIDQTNRRTNIKGKNYYILFDFDYDLSVKKDKIIEDNGMEYDIVRSKNYLYDRIVTLYFDKNWNFVK